MPVRPLVPPTAAPASPWQPIADGHYLGLTGSTRFPLYTRGNAGEVFPEVQYPLSYTVNWETSTKAFEAASRSSGLLVDADFGGDPAALVGVFGGYTYLNLSAQRIGASRVPGGDMASVDQQYLGSSDAPPHLAAKGDRRLRSSISAIGYGIRTMRTKALPQLAVDQRAVQTWLASIPPLASATSDDLVAFVRASTPFGAELFERHLIVSGQAAVPAALLVKFCTDKLGRAELAPRLLAGVGNVASAAPASALWDLGRLVANSAATTAHFDRGLSGLERRLRADPSVHTFVASFDDFLARFASRGPNEWETACETWGTQPALALALVDRMRGSADDHAPTVRHAALIADRQALVGELPQRRRKRLQQLTDSAALFAQSRERTKTTVIEYLHGVRVILNELDRRTNESSGGSSKDLWFVTFDEVDDYLAEPARYREQIAERRRMRELLSSREPPFIIDSRVGVPDFSTWRRRDEELTVGVTVGQRLTGISGCPGVARGRARVVLDPSDPTALEPGDVLVAPLTDPSWTPLFVPASAVIVNVGAMLSHAVIVSRELGIPSVVSVTDATRIIPDGALVEVDGANGTVTILELP